MFSQSNGVNKEMDQSSPVVMLPSSSNLSSAFGTVITTVGRVHMYADVFEPYTCPTAKPFQTGTDFET